MAKVKKESSMDEYQRERQEIRKLALLCLEERELTDEEIDSIIAGKDDLCRFFYGYAEFASGGAARIKRYRTRRAELEKMATPVLERMERDISESRSAAMRDDDDDDLPDSFFEAPQIDSDRHIIPEILKSRREAVAR